jgi:uncharacterized protein involved in exopolysaccharide biosynthesis
MSPDARWSEDEISLVDLFRTIMRRKWVVAISIAATTALALGIAFTMTPVYRVTMLLAPVGDENAKGLSSLAGQFGGLAALAGVSLGAEGSDKAKAVALLRSRALTEPFLRERDLLPVLYEDRWDPQAKRWKVGPDEVPTFAAAYRKFDQEIRSLSEDKKTGLVTVTIDWKDPARAVEWAGELVSRVNSEMRRRAIREAEQSLRYLDQELQKARLVEVQQAIYSLIESQTKKMMLANVREEYVFQVLEPPAIPDPKDKIRPKRAVIALLGLIVGTLLGAALALAIEARRGFGVRREAQA